MLSLFMVKTPVWYSALQEGHDDLSEAASGSGLWAYEEVKLFSVDTFPSEMKQEMLAWVCVWQQKNIPFFLRSSALVRDEP